MKQQPQAMPSVTREPWLAKNARPLLLVTLTAILLNTFLVAPYAALFGLPVIVTLPSEFWTLAGIAAGAYLMGRSGEKMLDAWRNGGRRRRPPTEE